MTTEYTAAQYNAAISAAIRDDEMGIVVDLLKLMAIHHPREAALTYDVMRAGLALSGSLAGREEQ